MVCLASGPTLEACEFDFEVAPAVVAVAARELPTPEGSK